MKVLFLLDSLSPGGTETSTVQLAGRLHDLDVECVIAMRRSGEHDLAGTARAHGVRVVRIDGRGVVGYLRGVRKLIARERPDILHTALFSADQMGRIASIGTGVRVVSSFVSTPYDPARLKDPNVVRWRLRAVQIFDSLTGRFLVDRFHAVSRGVMEANASALRLPCDRIEVVERGRDTTHLGEPTPERRANARMALGVDQHCAVVLSLGRLEHLKAQVDLIDAAEYLLERQPDLKVLIAGKDGSASSAVVAAAGRSDSTRAAIDLLGHRDDVGDLLAASDLLVISSHYEGTAGVALEAMSMGLPVVATDIEGLRGILEDGENAVLVVPASPTKLAEGIDRVLRDEDLANSIGRTGWADFQERFTLDVSATAMKSFYERLATDDRPSSELR